MNAFFYYLPLFNSLSPTSSPSFLFLSLPWPLYSLSPCLPSSSFFLSYLLSSFSLTHNLSSLSFTISFPLPPPLPSYVSLTNFVHPLLSLPLQDVCYHFVAAVFYLSASVALALVTIMFEGTVFVQTYQLDIAAVVWCITYTHLQIILITVTILGHTVTV